MKKVIPILFLIVLCFSQFSYYFIYQFQQRQIKKENKAQLFAKIPDSSFEIITAEEHSTDIQWREERKEFLLNDELYDVARIKTIKGKTLLYCINDKKEKELLETFAKAIKADAPDGKSGKATIKFQISDYVFNLPEKCIRRIVYVNQKFANYNSTLCTTIKEINAPPPRA